MYLSILSIVLLSFFFIGISESIDREQCSAVCPNNGKTDECTIICKIHYTPSCTCDNQGKAMCKCPYNKIYDYKQNTQIHQHFDDDSDD